MSTRTGDATADLRALLEESCPEVADEAAASGALGPTAGAGAPGGDAASGDGTSGDGAAGDGAAGDGAGEAALRWRSLTLGQIPGLNEVVSTIAAPVQVIAAVLKLVAGILDVISKLLLSLPDPFRALILAAYTLLKEIIDDFLASGAYLYYDAPGLVSNAATLRDMGLEVPPLPTWMAGDAPPTKGNADGFQRWAFRFEQSFDDPGDDDRPIFSDGAPVEALFIVATAPELVNLKPILALLAKLLDISAFEKAWEKYRADADDPDRARLRSTSTAPDWHSWKLRDIAPKEYPMRQLERIPELLKSLLLNVDDIIQLIRDLVEAIQDKVELLQELVDIVQAIIDMIEALTATGLHCLPVATDGGVEGLKKAFLEAEDRPNTDAEGKELTADAIVGVCLLAGTTNVLPIWALLGQQQSFGEAFQGAHEDWQALADTAKDAVADTKALATEAWEGVEGGGSSAEDLGVEGLWGELTDSYDEQKDTVLRNLGLTEAEADEQARSGRNELVGRLEQSLEEGAKLDPRVLAHVEVTRRARRRGRRSLAMAFGSPAREGDDEGGGGG